MKQKRSAFTALFIFVSFILYAQADTAVLITELPVSNMYKIDDGLYRGGQPGSEAFYAMEGFGISEVLNLRYYHSDDDEAVQSNIILHRVKMNAHHIKDEDIIAALRIIQNRQGPLLVHCMHGSDRTGVICAMYRIIFQNWSKQEAIEELMTPKFGHHKIYANIPRYIKNVNIENIKNCLTLPAGN